MDPTVENAAITPPEDQPEPRRRITPLVVGLTAGATLLVGLVAGIAIGWKIEQNRVKSDLENIRPVGTVVAVTDESLTVHLRTGSGGERTYRLTDATVIDKADPGAASDIEDGSTVFIRTRRGDDGRVEAAQVVVLPEDLPSGDQ
jgi:hypothetical protein